MYSEGWGKQNGAVTEGFKDGDIITCKLDIEKGTLKFLKNEIEMGFHYTFQLEKDQIIYPAVSCYYVGQGCEILQIY